MADHRAEQVVQAITTALTGLATTASNVSRDRIYNVDDDDNINEALSVFMGSDAPVSDDESSWAITSSILTVRIEIFVKSPSTTPISQVMNQIRKEITIALMSNLNPVLGLNFCEDIVEGEAEEPEINKAEQPTGLQNTYWHIQYQRSRTDASA